MPRAGPSQTQNQDREPTVGANQLSDALRFGMESIAELCNEVLPLCDAEARKEIMKKLDTNFKKLVQAEILYENSPRIIASAVEELEGVDEDADDKVILKCLEKSKKVAQKERSDFERKTTGAVIKRDRRYINFNEQVSTALAEIETNDDDESDTDTDEINSDEEEESVTDMVPIVDPISKRPLTDPVRNKICKHIYGKKSMVDLIKQNQRVRCPTIGCSNQQFIREKDLEFDDELTHKVRRRVKKDKRQQQQRMQQD